MRDPDTRTLRIFLNRYVALAYALGVGATAVIQQSSLFAAAPWGLIAVAAFLIPDRVKAKRQTESWLGQWGGASE